MNIILFDTDKKRAALLPFTYTRPVADIRIGIFTIAEKWKEFLGLNPSFYTSDYLSRKFKSLRTSDNYLVEGSICPDTAFVHQVENLEVGEALIQNGKLLACRVEEEEEKVLAEGYEFRNKIEYKSEIFSLDKTFDIFRYNASQIAADLELIKRTRKSVGLSDPHTKVYGVENIFVEEGAIVRAAVINAETGPVYIGKDAVINEGAIVRGALALCEGSQISMGAKLRGDSTIGPHSKVGGEVSNSVIFGYSNKGHDGFLGNSVIGEWCNLGADTNASNLKNDYSNIKLWDYDVQGFRDSGLQFCGLIMGDHAKSGISTMFNTGTTVGVGANVFGSGFPRNFIPSFSWGGAHGFNTYRQKKMYEVAQRVMDRRGVDFEDLDKEILNHVFELSKEFRIWDNYAV